MCQACENKSYVALHNHCEMSTLDGYSKVSEYVKKAKELGMVGLGLTDHGTMSGIYQLIDQCNKQGLIPVPGIEFYVAPENPLGAKVKTRVYYGKNGLKAPKYDVGGNGAYLHLTLFAYNKTGLKNLFKLTALSWEQENYYFKPRIDTSMLFEHSEGLIATTGCPASEISRRFLLGQDDKAYEYATRMKEVFGDNYYVELMNHNMPNDDIEKILLPKLIKLAKDLNIKVIATNDSHYANKEDAFSHERMLAIQSKGKMNWTPMGEMSDDSDERTAKRFAFSGDEYYIKDYHEMHTLYPKEIADEALMNTIELTEKCRGMKLEYDTTLRPQFKLPDGYNSNVDLLKEWIKKGFKEKRNKATREVKEESIRRVKEELKVIHGNDFVDFFLILADIINWSINNGVPVGRGRGSAAGSEIGYLLNIHDTDPIKYGLLFERFLSPGRGATYKIIFADDTELETSVSTEYFKQNNGNEVKQYVHELKIGDVISVNDEHKVIKDLYVLKPGSSPDIDTDFHTEGRAKVIEYIKEKYGKDNVANIITLNTFAAKKAFKDVCTIYSKPAAETQKIANTIPDKCKLIDLFNPLSDVYSQGEDFRGLVSSPDWKEIVKVAIDLQGRISHTGVHACGLIISTKPLTETIPIQIKQEDGLVLTQWTYPECESLGLLKMDILGLDTVDLIYRTLDNIKLLGKEVPDIKEVGDNPTDKKTYELLQKGLTEGVFQFNGEGVSEILRLAKPTNLDDLSAITALYRPGPMETKAHIEWANRKNGSKEVEVLHPDFAGTAVERILEPTLQLTVFQEQTMKIAQEAAGFTSYEADLLRKAMGKKNFEVMQQMEEKFVNGLQEYIDVSEEAAQLLWDTLEGFAAYAFNMSHSTSYSIVGYTTAYLKAHYPVEFMSALLEGNKSDKDKVRIFLQECSKMGIKVGPVDINSSQETISPTKNGNYHIVYGFGGIKGINDEIGRIIVKERNENGLFTSVDNFVSRILKKEKIKKTLLSQLANAGAFDCFNNSRKAIVDNVEIILNKGVKTEKKGMSLFDMGGVLDEDDSSNVNLFTNDYSYLDKIKSEADAIGLFISGHPIDNLGVVAKTYYPSKIKELKKRSQYNTTYTVLGTISAIENKVNKQGFRRIIITVDDKTDTFNTGLNKSLVEQVSKSLAIDRMNELKLKGRENELTPKEIELIHDDSIIEKPIILNDVYRFTVKVQKNATNSTFRIVDFEKLEVEDDGSLPFQLRIPSDVSMSSVENIILREFEKGGTTIQAITYNGTIHKFSKKVALNRKGLLELEKLISYENIVSKGV